MKKILAAAVAFSLLFATIPAYASSKDEPVYITEKYNVKQETTLPLTDVPALVIAPDSAYSQDFSFQIELIGAKFTNYSGSGVLAGTNQGVSYIKIGEDKLRLNVDSTKFDMTSKELQIPLYTTLLDDGDITVSIDPKDSPVPPASLTFANKSEKKYILEVGTVKALEQQGQLGDIVIRDKSNDSVTVDTVFTLQLDNGFQFAGDGKVAGTGKFLDKVKFEIDKSTPSKAYITVTKNTDKETGNIVLSSASAFPQTKISKFGEVNLSLSWPNDSTVVQAANYVEKSTYRVIEINEFEGGYKPSASGIAASAKTLQVRIDDDDYGEIKVEKDGTWKYVFPYEFSNIKPGKHTFAIGYYQASTDHFFDAVTKDFEIAPEKTTTTVIFTVDSTTYSFGDKPGYLEAPAFIDQNGRTMLPLRAVSKTLGVAEENINWDASSQTVTVIKDGKTVVCQIGKQELVVNGKIEKLDTAAVIVNGRTFLPLRPLLNALGVSDDNIQWDKELKAVTFEV